MVEVGAGRDLVDQQDMFGRGRVGHGCGDQQWCGRRRGNPRQEAHKPFRVQSNRMPKVSCRCSTASA